MHTRTHTAYSKRPQEKNDCDKMLVALFKDVLAILLNHEIEWLKGILNITNLITPKQKPNKKNIQKINKVCNCEMSITIDLKIAVSINGD